MSKSRYCPYKRKAKWIKQEAEHKHRRRIKQWLRDFENKPIPSEVFRKKFFADWYW